MRHHEVLSLLQAYDTGGNVGLGAVRTASVHPHHVGVALGLWVHGPGDFGLAIRDTENTVASRLFAASLAQNVPQLRIHRQVVGQLWGPRPIVRTASSMKSKLQVLTPGASIAHPSVTAGTLGAFVKKIPIWGQEDDGIYVLSNNHVLANVNTVVAPTRSNICDPILQPGPSDGGKKKDQVACLADFHRMQLAGETMDAAIAVLAGGLHYDQSVNGNSIQGVASVAQGQRVWKFGRTTGMTWGTVGSTHVKYLPVKYPNANANGTDLSIFFNDQIEVFGDTQQFSQGGDSGSVVFDQANRAVGLLFAGIDPSTNNPLGYTLMTPIQRVLDRFRVYLI